MNTMHNKLILTLLLAGLVVSACTGGAPATPTGQAPAVVVDNFAVIAGGRLLPHQSVQLSFNTGGKITELLAEKGAQVAAGEVIARLEGSKALQAQVAGAQLELLNAQQTLTRLQDSAAMTTAQAEFAVVQALDALDKAQKDLRNVETPVSQHLLDTARDTKVALDTAQANLQLANVSQDVQAYESNVWSTDWYFRKYQDAKAKLDKNPDSLELQDAARIAQADYQARADAQAVLLLRIQTAKANEANTVAQAQKAYSDAAANLETAKRGPNASKLAIAKAKVALAEVTLADAQKNFNKVRAGPDPDQLALAQARMTSAQAALAAAQSALENSELKAPIAGTLAELKLKVGEQVAPGQPIATIADFSGWLVETDNLTEIEVVKIGQGQGATVALDALPGEKLPGEVTDISSVFEEKRGDITYVVTIALKDQRPPMRWGMTAQVTFDK